MDEQSISPTPVKEAPEVKPEPTLGIGTTQNTTTTETVTTKPADPLLGATKSTDNIAQNPTTPSVNPLAISKDTHRKSNLPVAEILIAIVVALALAGLVVYVYSQSKNSQQTDKNSKTTTSESAIIAKPQASTTDVDTTTQEVDQSLEQLNDSSDFSSSDLSDSSLGL